MRKDNIRSTNEIVCPLCRMNRSKEIDQISTTKLKSLYEKVLRLDISLEIENIPLFTYFKCQNCDLNFFLPQFSGSESLYEDLQQFNWYYLNDKNEYNIAKQFIQSTDDILEIGCGIGIFSDKINSNSYTGLELSKSAQKKGLINNRNILRQTIENHSNNNREKYSVVCSFQVLEHVENPYSFLKSSIDCLKNEGYLIISIPSEDSFIAFATNNPMNLPPHHVTRWSDLAIRHIATLFDVNLVHIEHESLADIHRKWYSRIFVMRKMSGFFLGNTGLINDTIQFRLLYKISSIPAIIYSIFIKYTGQKKWGHSVIAVYQKKNKKQTERDL